jgi:hypothetical protein
MSPDARPWDELRREVERLLGMPLGSSEPLEGIRKDARRFEGFLGAGFVDAKYVADAIRLRVEAAIDTHIPAKLVEIPKRLLQARPPGLNGFRRR